MLTETQLRNKKFKYLITNVFQGLENLNNGFDAEPIFYFSETDFEIVLNRVEKLGLDIYGIEPWLNGGLYEVMVSDDLEIISMDEKWYRKAFAIFKKRNKNLIYAATYQVPIKLLIDE